ncbi:MAG: radical SAM protein [Thermodesulfovibrionales bacterium]|nr:radical SAM protein [Thermodesulfovibrionales bacterium]
MMHTPLRFMPSVFSKKRPVHLTFFVTGRCNQKCPFCFYTNRADAATGDTKETGSDPLSMEEIEKISSSMDSLLWLAFSGGEVFLRDDIVDISKVFYKNNRPSILLYPTNGMMPGLIKERISEILRHCKKSTVVVKLSIDGIDEKHDRMRGTAGSFLKVMETYGMLSGLLREYPNFELGINTVFCSLNEDYMDEILEFVKGLDKIKTHTISLVRGNSYTDTDINKYLKAAEKLEAGMKNRTSPMYGFRGAKVKAAQDILQRRLIYRTITEDRQQIPCYAGRLNLVLTETGEVFPCESFTMGMGNARDYDCNIKKLLGNNRAMDVNSLIEKNKCHCSHECYMMTNILFNPRTYPALLKEYLQL